MNARAIHHAPVLLLGILATCAIAKEEPGMTAEMELNAQFETVLAEFETTASRLDVNHPHRSSCSIEKLKNLVSKLQQSQAACARHSGVAVVARKQTARPVGPVEPDRNPPNADQLERMQRAMERTHLPGPSLVAADNDTKSTFGHTTIGQVLADAIELLELIQAELQDKNAGQAQIIDRLNQARRTVEQVRTDSVCPPENS
jgi:hypothetical protein